MATAELKTEAINVPVLYNGCGTKSHNDACTSPGMACGCREFGVCTQVLPFNMEESEESYVDLLLEEVLC